MAFTSAQDLGKAIAKYVIVFNCSDGLDYKSMGRMFSGLAQTGAWSWWVWKDSFMRIYMISNAMVDVDPGSCFHESVSMSSIGEKFLISFNDNHNCLSCCFAGLTSRCNEFLTLLRRRFEYWNLDRSAYQVLSVVAQQILSILRAITLGLQEFDFEGSSLSKFCTGRIWTILYSFGSYYRKSNQTGHILRNFCHNES